MWDIIVMAMVVCAGLYSLFIIRRMNRETEAMRQAACIIMGLPQNTAMKEFKRMYKEYKEKNKHG